jgi:hypothetical protein
METNHTKKATKYSIYYFTIIVFGVFNLSCSNWKVPIELTGKWISQQDIVLRIKKDGKYEFSKHFETVLIQINADATITGSIGNAQLENCKIVKNRGKLGRSLNLKTDYRIIGKLKGKINSFDNQEVRSVSMPFNVENNIMEGSIFESSGFDIFPFADMNLKKSSQ